MSYEQVTGNLCDLAAQDKFGEIIEELENMEPGEAAYCAIKIADAHPDKKIALLRALRECLPGAF